MDNSSTERFAVMHKNTLQITTLPGGGASAPLAHACGCQDVGIQSDIKYIFKYKKSEKGQILRHIQAAPTAVYSQVSPYFPYENFFYEIRRDRLFWKPSLPIHEVSRPWGIKAYVVPYRERRSW